MVPQVLITLSPAGDLQAELPGPNGARRIVKLDPQSAGYTIKRMLSAQLQQGPWATSIGTPAQPTNGQVRHWEQHADSPDERCPWCIAQSLGIDVSQEALAKSKSKRSNLRNLSLSHKVGNGTITVRRLKKKSPHITSVRIARTNQTCNIKAEDLGL